MLQPDHIAQWRERIFSFLLPTFLVLGALGAIPSFILASAQNEWQAAAVRAFSLAWVAGIWWFSNAPYRLRVLSFLAMTYVVAVCLLAILGPATLNYLIAPPITAVILLGMRAGAFTLALCAASLLALAVNGVIRLHVTGLENDPLSAGLLTTLNFLCVGAVVTLTSGTLLRGLARSLGNARQSASELERLNLDLRLTSDALARLNDMVLIARSGNAPGERMSIIFVNDATLRHTGYARDEIIGSSVSMFAGPDTDPATLGRMAEAVGRHQATGGEIRHYKRNGEPYWAEVELVPFTGDDGAVTHWLAVGRDITERRSAADAISRLAYYDVLTGLPNRRLLLDRLGGLVAAARHGDAMAALLYIDLDNFKTINDARGHAVGDLVLIRAAELLGLEIGEHDTVARLGGDEFVVLMGALGTTIPSHAWAVTNSWC